MGAVAAGKQSGELGGAVGAEELLVRDRVLGEFEVDFCVSGGDVGGGGGGQGGGVGVEQVESSC